MAEMTNIEIRDFTTVQGVNESDFVVLSLVGGSSAKMAVGLFRSSVTNAVTPSIKDSVWWIGSTNTEVVAEGKTPEFRKGGLGIEWRYTYEADTAWRLLVPLEDIRFRFDELTPEQRDMVKLKYSDLTAAEIAELQKPANDMIAVLERTNDDIQTAEEARVGEFAILKQESEASTKDAQDTADHPTYIGEDNYVYKWNKTAKTYDKTAIYVRGEAFTIKKVYPSIDAMLSDRTTTFKEGDFCLIDTGDVENPDNAKLYVRSAVGAWDFLVDMSGAIGFTGKVPQLFIGSVSIGSGRNSAAVTLTPDGTDTDGNPKYRINYVIPCLAYEDLTQEQISELQRPANEMIAVLQATDTRVNENETVRQTNETIRQDKEEERKENEIIRQDKEGERKDNEIVRQEKEEERKDSEEERKGNEESRVKAEEDRVKAEEDRVEDYAVLRADIVAATDNANTAAGEARNTPAIKDGTWWVYSIEQGEYIDTKSPATSRSPKIEDGIWWVWDDANGAYVSTGWAVNSDFVLTKGKIEGVFTGDIDSHTHDHVRYRAQMYDDMPDFANLTTWTDEQGEHPFRIGNDIYVRNEAEPTGYANYKLSPSLDGNVWVRIPQVAAGWRVVLVRE